MRHWLFTVATAAMVTMSSNLWAQSDHHPSEPLGKTTAADTVAALKSALTKYYVFEDKAKEMAGDLDRRLAAGEYNVADTRALASKLNADLKLIAHDGHLNIFTTPRETVFPEVDPRKPTPKPTAQEEKETRSVMESANYGIARVQRLDGNIGLLELTNFWAGPGLNERLAGVFNFLSGTDALIIDLRANGGGDPISVAAIISHLVEGKVHVNSFRARGATLETFYTTPDLAPKYLNKPVIVLTSAHSFSGAEEFAYDLQAMKRATIMGEVTGGGANPANYVTLVPGIAAQIPYAEAHNPITKANWEGKGVTPEVVLDKDIAYYEAYLTLLKGALPAQEKRATDASANYGIFPVQDENRMAQEAVAKKLQALRSAPEPAASN